MNIRTTNQLYDALSQELIWRKKELTDLKLLIDDRNQSHSKRNVLLRSGVALLYAHWEGFIKAGATVYLQFIASQRLKNKEVALHILAVSARPLLNNATGANNITAHLQVAQFFIEQRDDECKIQYKDVIRTSNLNYELFVDIGRMLGIDLSLADTSRHLIDDRLLKNRNSIAHGEYLVIDSSAYNILHYEVIKLLDLFRNEITNCAIEKKYLSLSAMSLQSNEADAPSL